MIDQQHLRSLYEHHADGIAECDRAGIVRAANPALERITGYPAHDLHGRSLESLATTVEQPKIRAAFQEALAGKVRDVETVIVKRDGTSVDVAFDAIPIVVDREVLGAYAVLRDVTRLRSAMRALRDQDERIRSLYLIAATQNKSPQEQINEVLRVGCGLLGMQTGFVSHVSAGMLKVTHVHSKTLTVHSLVPIESSFSRRILESEIPLAIDNLRESPWTAEDVSDLTAWSSFLGTRIRVGRTSYGTLEFRDPSPRETPFSDTDRDLVALMSAFIAAELQRERTEEQLDKLAYYDGLTKLPNRSLFNDRLAQAVAVAKRAGKSLALLFLDLDRFKEINDELGHEAGDLVLRVVGERLRSVLRQSDTVGRLGGDEFTILLPEIQSERDPEEAAQKVLDALSVPIRLGQTERSVTTSIGIAVYPNDGHSLLLLMKHADMAMYTAKQTGRNRFARYAAPMAAGRF